MHGAEGKQCNGKKYNAPEKEKAFVMKHGSV
jgi:hypothetical protein